jgi:dTDP-4-dehydrorhamnose reductase
MSSVLVLGASGMLGSMVTRVLSGRPGLEVVAATRDGREAPLGFEVGRNDVGELLDAAGCEWIVNALGVVKPRIDERSSASLRQAIEVNALFPLELAVAAGDRGRRVIHIATDGVFSGRDGARTEDAVHDAPDAYGKTKSLGEASADNVLNLRCSIVGPDERASASLLQWLLSQPHGARVTGFTNQRWNGVTTYHFARLCEGVIREDLLLPGTLHVVPRDVVSKAVLLDLLAGAFGRKDITIAHEPAPLAVDRSLATKHAQANEAVWQAAGYPVPPDVDQMVLELADRECAS